MDDRRQAEFDAIIANKGDCQGDMDVYVQQFQDFCDDMESHYESEISHLSSEKESAEEYANEKQVEIDDMIESKEWLHTEDGAVIAPEDQLKHLEYRRQELLFARAANHTTLASELKKEVAQLTEDIIVEVVPGYHN